MLLCMARCAESGVFDMRAFPLAIVCLLIAALLAGCFTPSDPPAIPAAPAPAFVEVVQDVIGDATVGGSYELQAFAADKCRNVPLAAPRSACWENVATKVQDADAPSAGGTPEPTLDVLGLSFRETPTTLDVRIAIAELPEGLAAWAPDSETSSVVGACWVVGEDADKGWECAYIYAYEEAGTKLIENAYDRYSPDCNDWWWCTWHVPYTFEYGSPGAVTLSIPRAIMGAQNGTLTQVGVVSSQNTWTESEPSWSVATADSQEFGTLRMRTSYNIDATDEVSYTFQTVADSTWESTPSFADTKGDVMRSDIDLLATTVTETADGIIIGLQVADVSESPKDHGMYAAFAVMGGSVREVGYDVVDGKMEPWGGYCTTPDAADCGWKDFTVGTHIVPGADGWVHFTIPRAELGDVAAGDLVSMVWSASMVIEGPSAPLGPATARIYTSMGGDWNPPSPPYWLTMGAPAEAAAAAY